jgi:hypothetical protein
MKTTRGDLRPGKRDTPVAVHVGEPGMPVCGGDAIHCVPWRLRDEATCRRCLTLVGRLPSDEREGEEP